MLVGRLVLIWARHFQIFGLTCGSGRVVCGGKVPQAEPAFNFAYKVSYLLLHLELRKTDIFQHFFRNALKSYYRISVQCNSVSKFRLVLRK